jgi:hypothetical protein
MVTVFPWRFKFMNGVYSVVSNRRNSGPALPLGMVER